MQIKMAYEATTNSMAAKMTSITFIAILALYCNNKRGYNLWNIYRPHPTVTLGQVMTRVVHLLRFSAGGQSCFHYSLCVKHLCDNLYCIKIITLAVSLYSPFHISHASKVLPNHHYLLILEMYPIRCKSSWDKNMKNFLNTTHWK